MVGKNRKKKQSQAKQKPPRFQIFRNGCFFGGRFFGWLTFEIFVHTNWIDDPSGESFQSKKITKPKLEGVNHVTLLGTNISKRKIIGTQLPLKGICDRSLEANL